jgi:hypothetical protein
MMVPGGIAVGVRVGLFSCWPERHHVAWSGVGGRLHYTSHHSLVDLLG